MGVLVPHEALTRIQIEYVEIPGLKLTPEQIGCLCGLPADVCERALAMLTRSGFLQQSLDASGTFVLFSRRPNTFDGSR